MLQVEVERCVSVRQKLQWPKWLLHTRRKQRRMKQEATHKSLHHLSQPGTASPQHSICVSTFRPRTRETDACVRAAAAVLSAPDGSHPATEG